MKKNDYITIPQLAEILGISRVAVYNKVKKGEIEAIRIGRNFAIPKEYLKEKVGNIIGRTLKVKEKQEIDKAVEKTIKEYGEVLKLLGNE